MKKKTTIFISFLKIISSLNIIFLALILNGSIFAQPANHVVISEVAPMGGSLSDFNTGEFIELYNPISADFTFGANDSITSGAGTSSNAANWSLSLAGKTIKAFGYFLIGDGVVTVTPDLLFPANHNLANSGTRSSIQLKNGINIIDAFGWDPSKISTPYCETAALKPTGTNSDKKSFERKSGPFATSHDSLGNAWDSNNNSVDFFENKAVDANPQNSSSPIVKNPYNIPTTTGPGVILISPAVWKYDASTTLQLVLKANTSAYILGLKIIKPQSFNWYTSSISFSPNTIVQTQSGDTTIFSNFILSGTDSVVITIPNVTCQDTTNEFTLSILTSSDGSSYSPISLQPKTIVYGSPKNADVIKAKSQNGTYLYLGKWVVMKGVVTAANDFGGPSYLQDSTSGFAIYDSSVSNHVAIGDEITVLGKVAPYSGLFELTPASILDINGEGIGFDTLTLTIPQIKTQNQNGFEPYEARLIRINNIEKVLTTSGALATAWTVTGSGTNYNLVAGTDTIQVRISPKTNLVNLSTPSGKFDIIGELGQYNTLYQLLPRSYEDIIVEGSGPRIISGVPYETNMTPNSITFNFQTDVPGNSIIFYGKTTSYDNVVSDNNSVTSHQITVSGLEPSTVYHLKIGSASNNDTTYTADYIAETSSLTSSGQMNVYFNHSIDTSVSDGEKAQDVNIYQKLINRIDSSQYSIDLAIYSLSGTVGNNIVNALLAAKKRGVKIRAIGEYDNSNSTSWVTLKNSGVPVIFDNFDPINDGAGLMHNKFYIFDNRDTTDTNDWVWTGSWNATDPGNSDDAQNVILIQDKSLANAYTLEFNEMWGSDNDTPNAANSRFGVRKLDNTPHKFNIAGVPVELYFDPSDHTTMHIADILNASVSSIDVAMLTFTRSDLAQILVNKKSSGEKVHVILDNNTDTGNQFAFLKNNGVDVLLKGNDISGYFHHKYAIIDAGKISADQVVMTGSHNWSSSAENSNNENMLILHSPRIANLYLQEFKARYVNAGGTEIISDVAVNANEKVPDNFELKQNYPNPFNPSTTITFSIPKESNVTLKIFNLLGQEVKTLLNQNEHPGIYTISFDAHGLSSGVYFYCIQAGNYYQVKKMLLLK